MAPPAEMGARRLDPRSRATRAATKPASPARTRPVPDDEAAPPPPTFVAASPRTWLLALGARATRILRRLDARTSVRAHDADAGW